MADRIKKLATSGTLTPAYGSLYWYEEDIINAFYEGDVFLLQDGLDSHYCTVDDFALGASVTLCYSDDKETTIIVES